MSLLKGDKHKLRAFSFFDILFIKENIFMVTSYFSVFICNLSFALMVEEQMNQCFGFDMYIKKQSSMSHRTLSMKTHFQATKKINVELADLSVEERF